VTEVVGDLHAGYDTLCAKALQREPADRFQDALEMADAVERAAREAGETAASERQVAALMKARYGDDVAQQRDALRNWLQATPTSVVDESENVTQKDLDGLEAIPAPPKTIRGLGGSTPPARQPSSAPPPPPKRASKAPNTQRAWPKGAAGIGAPQSPDEDETLIYDPTSTTGVTAEPLPESYLTPLVPPAPPSLDPPLPMRSNRRWVIAVLGAVAVGVLGVFVIRRLTVTDDAGAAATTVQTSQDPQEHVPVPPPEPEIADEDTADEDTADEAQALASAVPDSPPSAASSAPEASSAPPQPLAAAANPPPKPASKPSPKPAPSLTPKPPPPKPASDLDDLSNPYR
jgi:hypothetical protein